MKNERTIKLSDREITACELSVKMLVEVLDNVTEGENINAADRYIRILFPEYVSASVVCKSTGMSLEEIENMLPEDLETLFKEVTELNPFFRELCRRLVESSVAIISKQPLKKSDAG